eukprot:278335-Chlamydomonas_euryale.AAC.12
MLSGTCLPSRCRPYQAGSLRDDRKTRKPGHIHPMRSVPLSRDLPTRMGLTIARGGIERRALAHLLDPNKGYAARPCGALAGGCHQMLSPLAALLGGPSSENGPP